MKSNKKIMKNKIKKMIKEYSNDLNDKSNLKTYNNKIFHRILIQKKSRNIEIFIKNLNFIGENACIKNIKV